MFSIYANTHVSGMGSDSRFLRRSTNGLNDSATDVSVDEITNVKLRVFIFLCVIHVYYIHLDHDNIYYYDIIAEIP